MYKIVVGVDIAKLKFDVASLTDGKYKHKTFTNDVQGYAAFLSWLAAVFVSDNPMICMEATDSYSLSLADYMVSQGYPVSVVNPAKIKAFAGSELSRTKTDKSDAKLIARYALTMPALSAWRHNPVIRAFGLRLKANGKNGKAIVCAAMRKLIHLSYAILKSGEPFDSNFSLIK